jgi:bifunctional DNase/RNase
VRVALVAVPLSAALVLGLAAAQGGDREPEKSDKRPDRAGEHPSDKAAPSPTDRASPPAGDRAGPEHFEEAHSRDWSEAEVWQVIPDASGGGIVLLRTRAMPRRIIPIAVGPAETLAIRLKMAGATFARPLTHDLLDQMVRQLGARIVKVRIEKIANIQGHEGGTFFGRVFFRQGRRQLDIDARASDSIALAMRADVPIFVSTQVVEKTGFDAKRFEEEGETPASPHRSRTPSEPL